VPDDGGGIGVTHAGDGTGVWQNMPNALQYSQEGKAP
jgi:hypothetical protein